VIPSVGEIRTQIATVLEREPDARVFGLSTPAAGSWPATITVNTREFSILYCDSALAFRQALQAARGNGAGLVVLTPLAERALGADVLARLARGRLFHVRQWEMVRHAFRALSVDPRLAPYGWMAELLIEHMPPEGYAPAPSGVLDAETAWRTFLRVSLGLDAERLDLDSLLLWTANEDAAARWAGLSDEMRGGTSRWVEENLGPAGRLVMETLVAGWLSDALPLGLIVDLVFSGDTSEADLAAAAVRLERYTSGQRLQRDAARKWADAAVRVVRQLQDGPARAILSRADRWLTELYLQSRAAASQILSAGFTARLTEFGDRLERFLEDPGQASLRELERVAGRAREHSHAASAATRMERLEMSVRVARWLTTAPIDSQGFTAQVTRYVSEGGFVDWARWKLLGGDPVPSLSRALNALAERAQTRREDQNQTFALTLASWNGTGGSLEGAVPIERVLDRVVAPLAGVAPVLLLVADGLSLPVFYELASDISKQGWESLTPAEGVWHGAAIATLPTVTEVSRASLLTGRITRGAQQAEKTGFTHHAGLLQHSRGRPPVLFHKGELGDGVGLATDVQEALRATEPRVVAVVYNAIDDQLSGASQLQVQWSLENLRLMAAILHEAQGAGRIVVLTSDHGHVLDHESRLRAGGEGDRWRGPDGALEPGEITLEGGRVLVPSGSNVVTLPWSERIRYGSKKNGYHGGASPQEVIVPLRVYARFGMTVPGWQPGVISPPEWWFAMPGRELESREKDTRDGAKHAETRPALVVSSHTPVRAAASPPQADLFPSSDLSTSAGHDSRPVSARDWIDDLLRSPIYQTQKTLAARVAPSDDLMRRLLEALSARGGKLAVAALATRLGMPVLRVPGLLSAARRVLNLDQQPVLRLDEASGTIELNRPLLDTQFELGAKRATC
jgi:hypothetical protein